MKKFITLFIFISLGSLLSLSSCGGKSTKNVDVSDIKVEVDIQPFYIDFATLSTGDFNAQEALLQKKYNSFYPFYINDVMGGFKVAGKQQAERENILNFLGDTGVKALYDTVLLHYKDMSGIQKDLEGLYKHLKYYFPTYKLPKPVAIISEYSYAAFTYDTSVLAISLDMYLGSQYPIYSYLEIPRYVQRKLRKDFIVVNSADVLYNLYFGDDDYQAGTPLLDAMINKGKKLYFMEMMLPQLPDSMLMGYTKEQEAWCRSSEYAIWQYMNQRDLLYTQNFMEHKRYLSDGPTTSGMPPESPGNIGSWVGWQIVRKFMKEADGKISLNDLLTKYDAKVIIAKARYKPKNE